MPTTTIAVEAGEKPFQDTGGAKRMSAVTGMQAVRTRHDFKAQYACEIFFQVLQLGLGVVGLEFIDQVS